MVQRVGESLLWDHCGNSFGFSLHKAELEIKAGHRPFSEQIAKVTDKSTPRSAIVATSTTCICVQSRLH